MKDHREALDECIIEYSQEDALKRYSETRQSSFNHQDQVEEYKCIIEAITECPDFERVRLSSFQTCLLFQTKTLTGVSPLQCYGFSEIDNMKGPYTLIRSVYSSENKVRQKKNKGKKIDHL